VSDYWDGGKRFVPKREGRGTGDYEFFELSLAQGPTAIGVTGQNRLIDFIGTAWLLLLDLDMQLRLFRQGAVGEWTEVTTLLPPVFDAPLPAGARRVSFAFDQSARVVVAYEYDGLIYLTRWNAETSAYVQNVAFAGVDPVVIFDAVWSFDIPDSDVLLFYLTTDRTQILCRVQRELYSIARSIHDYGEPTVLDRVVRVPVRYEVLASDEAGEPYTDGVQRMALISEPYPYLAESLLGAGGTPLSPWDSSFGLSRTIMESVVVGSGVPLPFAYISNKFTYIAAEQETVLGSSEAVGPWDSIERLRVYTAAEAELVLGSAAVLSPQESRLVRFVYTSLDQEVVAGGAHAVGPFQHRQA
jgi:hypothetical protein